MGKKVDWKGHNFLAGIWRLEEDEQGTRNFRFIGTLPETPEADKQAEFEELNSPATEIFKTWEQIPEPPKLLRAIPSESTRREAIFRLIEKICQF